MKAMLDNKTLVQENLKTSYRPFLQQRLAPLAATEKEALSWEETLAAAGVVTATSSETLEPMKAKVLFFGH